MLCVNARFLTQRITGSQRYAAEIARRLRRLAPDARFLTPAGVVHRELAAELGAEPIGKRSGVAWEQLDLPAHLRRLGSPLLASMQCTAPLAYPRTLVTIHDLSFLRRAWVGTRLWLWYRVLVPRVARRARRLVTVSAFSKREIVARLGVNADAVEIVPGAAAPELARLAQDTVNHHGRYLLWVGTFSRRKNLDRLLEAFRMLRDPELRLVLAGDEDPRIYGRGGVPRGVDRDPRIVLPGRVGDGELAALYAHAAAFVYPSLHEGFGIPPLEAMSVACPVIASAATSVPEVCGDAAVYVDPHDARDIAQAIERVLDDAALRRELVARGHARVQHYDWDRSAQRFLEVTAQA